jgi:hypothetical protein
LERKVRTPLRFLENSDLPAIRTDPGDVIAGQPPGIFLHATLADLESAGTGPAESELLKAAAAIIGLPLFFPFSPASGGVWLVHGTVSSNRRNREKRAII